MATVEQEYAKTGGEYTPPRAEQSAEDDWFTKERLGYLVDFLGDAQE